MNAVTVLLFWIILAPYLFPTIDWSNFISAWMGFRMITMHTLPAISTFTNLYLSDVTMIPSDWWWIAAIGVSYTGANYIGTKAMGVPIYPVADWVNPTKTIALYSAAGMAMGGIFYFAAR
jgi:hypothetical protein